MSSNVDPQSTRPYLVRAIYEWCTDMHFTPHVTVHVDETVQVPREFVRGNEIVLNISFDATTGLQLNNDYIQFKARFAGVSREIMVPMNRVAAIYAVENGQGMTFPMLPPTASGLMPTRPALSRVKPLAETESDPQSEPRDAGATGRVLQLFQAEAAPATLSHDSGEDHEGDPGPDSPNPSPPKRPALTRVK